MATKNTVKRWNKTLSDSSMVYCLILCQSDGVIIDDDEIVIDCQDEKNQQALIEQLLIAGFKLV